MSGQETVRSNITGLSTGTPCVLTVEDSDLFSTNDFVRLTDMNSGIPVPRGMDPINNQRFRVIKTSSTTYKLQDPITFEDVDSTNFPPYVTGGSCNLIQTNFIYEA